MASDDYEIDPDANTFDSESADRIADAVRRVESQLQNLARRIPRRELSDPVNWVPFRNDAATTAVGCGILRVTGVVVESNNPILTIDRPDDSTAASYAFNSPGDVASGSYGLCTFEPPVLVAYDTGTPAYGDKWGPKSGQWTAAKDSGSLLIALGDVDANNRWMLADRVGGAGSNRALVLLNSNLSANDPSVYVTKISQLSGSFSFDSNNSILAYNIVSGVGSGPIYVWSGRQSYAAIIGANADGKISLNSSWGTGKTPIIEWVECDPNAAAIPSNQPPPGSGSGGPIV